MGFELDQYRLKFNKIDPRWRFEDKYEIPWMSSNIKGYWKLEEASGTRNDETANNNDLTDNNTVLQGTGIRGSCADFESTNNESLSITNAAQTGLNFAGDHSCFCWVKPETLQQQYFFSKFTNNASGYFFGMGAATGVLQVVIFKAGSSTSFSSVACLSTAQWYFVGYTYDAVADGTSIITIYINGRIVGQVTNAVLMVIDNAAAFFLGAYSAATLCHDGLMDEACAYNGVMADNDILWLYLYGLSKVGQGYTV